MHKIKHVPLWVIFCLMIIQNVSAQTAKSYLEGVVSSPIDPFLSGVSITVTSNSGKYVANSTSDSLGVFIIEGLSIDSVYDFTFSLVGYQRKTVGNIMIRPNGNTLMARLDKQDTASQLDEVVVVGYGTQRKITLTGSIASIQTKEIKQSAVSNLTNALVGRLPGLIARQSTGATGEDGSKIWLRGQSTFSGSNSPLIMVDGVPRDGFEYIDPNEIESITILKDASSTAIYGVRGANGVILVTTRRGRYGKPNIQLNVERAVKTPMSLPKYLNSSDFFRLRKQGLINDGALTEAALYTDDYINRYDASKNWPDSLEYKYLYPDVNWLGELLKPASYRTVANANISGGSNNLRYFVSGSFFHENGIYNKTGDFNGYNTQDVENRFNFRSNVDMQLSSWLSAELNLSTIVRNQNMPDIYQDDFFTLLKKTPPYVMPMTNPDGSIAQVSGYTNPYGELVARGYQKPSSFYMQGTAGLTAKLDFLLPGLSARTRFSFDSYNSNGYYRSRKYYTYTYQGAGKYQIFNTGADFLNYALYNQNYYYNINPEFSLNYSKKLKRHSFSGMLLYLLTSKVARSSNAIGSLPYRQQGVTGRFTYNYDDRYLAEFDFGYNGSENFAQGRRFGFFPAVSAAWVLSREPFLKTARWLDLLKIRMSAGKVGNQDPGTRFAYQSTWNTNSNGYNFGTNYDNTMPGAVETAAGNPFVTWESAKKYNLGLDFSIKNGLLSFNGDAFFEHRTNIYQSSSAITSGLLGLVTFPKLNAGIVDNHGFDFVMGHINRIGKDIQYEVKATYTFARNKIKKYLQIPMPDRPWQQVTGTRINSIMAYVADGYFQSKDDIAKGPDQTLFGVMQPGDIRYKDLNGDGIINTYDRTYLPNRVSEPEKILGVSLAVSYKGFDVSALFQGAFGRSMYVGGSAIFGPQNDFSNLITDWKENYWTPERPNARYPRLMAIKNVVNTQYSTQWLWNANYVRLKNMEIGYSFPTRWINSIGLSKLRIYVNGNNLVTWTSLHLFDPEEDDSSPNYPLMHTYNAGVSISFK